MDSSCKKYPCDETEIRDDGKHHVDDVTVWFEFDWNLLLWLIVNFLLMMFILGGNLLTIFAIRKCRRLRAVTSNLFILSLAVSDMIVGLTVPYHMAFYLGPELGQSHTFCLLRFYIIIFACCISVWNLISIAIDRYIAILHPLHYKRWMTRRVAMLIIALGWCLGTSIACIPVFWNHWQTAVKCEFDEVLPTWYMAGIITPSFVIAWICMLLVYLKIWREASKQAKQMRKAMCKKGAPSDWKSVQVVLLILGGFTICWMPYFIVACAQIMVTFDTSPILYKGALTLAIFNSGLNPIIYAWKNKNFRKSFGLLLRCKSPNCVNASEYSVREHCHRNVSLIQTQETAENSCNSVTTNNLNGSVIQTQEPITAMVHCPVPASADANRQIMNGLNAAQLLYQLETNRVPSPMMVANESYSPCSPCEICKFVLGKKTILGDHIKETLIPWKCGEYNHHIINTIKCRW